MRLPRWAPWVQEILAGSPAITGVQTFEAAGITHKPCGHVLTLRTGATVAIQWVRTSADGGEGDEETVVTGEPPEPVTLPELPSSGRVSLALVEEHLAALIAGGANPEIRAVERKSIREDAGPRPCGVTVRMHSGAVVYALFLHAAPAGASTVSGGEEFKQREEV